MSEKIGEIYNQETTDKYYETVGAEREEKKKNKADKYFESLLPKDLKGKEVLDLGCGNGYYSEELIDRGAKRVVGLDLNEAMITRAQLRKHKKQLDNFDIVRGDIKDLPIKPKSFDLVVARFSLHYSPDLDSTLSQVAKALPEDGECIIQTNQTIAMPGGEKRLKELKGQVVPLILRIGNNEVKLKAHVQTAEDYRQAFKDYGLEIIEEKYFPSRSIDVDPELIKAGDEKKIGFEYAVYKVKKH